MYNTMSQYTLLLGVYKPLLVPYTRHSTGVLVHKTGGLGMMASMTFDLIEHFHVCTCTLTVHQLLI